MGSSAPQLRRRTARLRGTKSPGPRPYGDAYAQGGQQHSPLIQARDLTRTASATAIQTTIPFMIRSLAEDGTLCAVVLSIEAGLR